MYLLVSNVDMMFGTFVVSPPLKHIDKIRIYLLRSLIEPIDRDLVIVLLYVL